MKNIIFFILVLITSVSLGAQEEISREEWKKLSKKERREYKEQQFAAEKAEMKALLESREWVLEAFTIQDRYGQTFNIQPNINFVAVADEKATVQLGGILAVGRNGVGGVTVEGNVRKYELKEDKKVDDPLTLSLEVSGAAMGHVSMLVTVSSDGNASALLTDIQGNRFTYRGQVVSMDESRVFKGMTDY